VSEPPEDPLKIKATPAKRFFIEMLVKDIELLPAVLDLVDNSVDGARRLVLAQEEGAERIEGEHPYEGLHAELSATPAEFRIKDNCGGIDLALARNYAFRFGRPTDFPPVKGSVGQFGVGMKRALFKLGRNFLIDSATATSRFLLEVDIEEWERQSDSDWTFILTEADDSYVPAGPEAVGTEILVSNLHQTVSDDFSSSQVIASLRYQLRLRHREAMERGLLITLNDEAVHPFIPQLQSSDVIQPINKDFKIEEDAGTVLVKIYAGVAPVPPRTRNLDEDRGESFIREQDAGWYVFCNNRLLIAADRTSLTGWGNGMPVYHPQFRQFRGYIYLDSDNSQMLPWNTTKTGVDTDSRVWRRVFSEILQAGQAVIQLLNRVKDERQASETDEDQPLSQALDAAPALSLSQITSSPTLVYPRRSVVSKPSTQKIQYSVDNERFQRAAEALGTENKAEVGRSTFNFFYKQQIEDEDE
jgi:hypothetical protein